MSALQFINLTPEENQNAIIKGVELLINELKKDFKPKVPEDLMTRQETADLLKANLASIHNWTKRGLIQSYGLAGRVYYKSSEIENAIVKLKK